MSFVKHHMLESYLLQNVKVLQEYLVIGQQNLEFWHIGHVQLSIFQDGNVVKFCASDYFPHFGVALIVVKETVEVGPFFYFSSPLMQGGERG